MATWSIAALRAILTTETDADSPGSQELMDQLRENIEALLLLCFADGFTGTVTVIAETILTHADAAQDADEHDGRTLLITSGDAIGNMYTIDDTAAQTLTCTGDTMATDGVAVDDTFAILYDVKNNLDGHDHNGVNSKELGIALKAGGLNTGTADFTGAEIGIGSLVLIDHVDYAFFPNIYTELTAAYVTGHNANSGLNEARFGIYNSSGDTTSAYNVEFRYITQASAPMIFAIQNKTTGVIEHLMMSDKHLHRKKPKGFTAPIIMADKHGKQTDMSNYNEIALFDYPIGAYEEIMGKAKKDKKLRCTFLTDQYDYDKNKKIFKPKNLTEV